MRAALALAFLLLPAAAQAAARPAQAEIVVQDAREPDQANLDLDVMDGRRIAFHLSCRGDGRTVRCVLVRRGAPVAGIGLDPDAVLAGGARQTACRAEGVQLTLSVSDLIQTLPAPVADGYHLRVAVAPAAASQAPLCRL
ncbi:hypothetical protein QO010_003509 [Caulobacter ginsengisoli]|uniref:Transcriptional regulator n=1 Tax=Caulobacter ginsengisoli TaxID=400775 RepID=A0ABU0IUM6_9CAUL|nr:hypothetical protein [Caulobacter ginsengisoli]MDQ0465717.1 hypothetical protein [Caulobacter ginsengisoli]